MFAERPIALEPVGQCLQPVIHIRGRMREADPEMARRPEVLARHDHDPAPDCQPLGEMQPLLQMPGQVFPGQPRPQASIRADEGDLQILRRQRLIIQQLFDQQSNTAAGTVPLFQLDMWEHAFYLDYLNVKADYVKAVWNIANWQNVARRLDAARQKTSGLLVLS